MVRWERREGEGRNWRNSGAQGKSGFRAAVRGASVSIVTGQDEGDCAPHRRPAGVETVYARAVLRLRPPARCASRRCPRAPKRKANPITALMWRSPEWNVSDGMYS